MKPKMFVTRALPPKVMEKVFAYFDAKVNPEDRVLTKEEVIAGVKGQDALLCLLTDTIDAAVMDANPKLKVISNYAVGFNNIDVKEATKRKIPVCNTPGVLTETTADLALALMLGIARRVVEGDKFTREGKFKGWGPTMLLGNDVYGKVLGIIGMGRIGTAVARRAKAFNMEVIYWDIEANQQAEKELGVKKVDFELLLQTSDFISLHVLLNDNTKHLLGEKEFRKMKKEAYIINTARGPIIDERALVKALKEKVIAGAGLDVYEREPALEAGLMELENVILLPHLGSSTIETRTAMGMLALNNAINIIEGRRPQAIANPEVLN